MQIVIDINDKVYGLLKYFEEGMGLYDKKDDSDDVKTALVRAVINGTPLPKGHGDLVDKKEIIERYKSDCGRRIYTDEFIHDIEVNVPTIIKAETEGEDGNDK